MGHLNIELGEGSKALISCSNCLDSEWRYVILFWSRGSVRGPLPSDLEVEITDFATRMSWLRHGWREREEGNTFSISEALRRALVNLKLDTQEFDRLANLNEDPTLDVYLDNLLRPLTPMQIENVARLLRMKNGANFSVPGAGKTAMQLVLWENLRRLERVKGLLVVCPKSAFNAWIDEPIALFTTPPKTEIFNGGYIPYATEIVVVNYEQLENYEKVKSLKDWVRLKKALIVLDEAHRVKAGASAVRWRACRELSEVSMRTDLLTGTPMPQSFNDLKNLFSLSWPSISPNHFSEARLRNLKRGGVFVRTTKNELQLPPMRTVTVDLPMGDLQRQVYDALRFSYAGDLLMSAGEELQMARRGRAIMTLLAAASNPGLIVGRNSEDAFLDLRWPPKRIQPGARLLPTLEEFVGHEMPTKYDWILRFVAEAANNNRKVLIWSTFIGNLRALERLLTQFRPAVVYGATSNERRQEEISRFRNSPECSVLLTNPQTLGEGISLHHECHDAIYIDRSYNAGLYLQSLDRIHRLGLEKDQETRIFILRSVDSIDQRVHTRLSQKISILGKLMDDHGLLQASLPNDELTEDEVIGFDSFDFDDLARHLRGD